MKISNKIYKYASLAFIAFSLMLTTSCEDEDLVKDNDLSSQTYVGFKTDAYVAILPGETQVIEGKVYSSRPVESSTVIDLTLDMDLTSPNLDPNDYSVPSSVTIPAGSSEATFEITVTSNNLGFAWQPIVLGMEPIPGVSIITDYDGNVSDGTLEINYNKFTANVKELCEDNEVTISVTLDDWPEEVYWALVEDDSGSVVAENGPYSAYNNAYAGMASGTTVDTGLCLPDGSYTFYIFDDYGDGAGAVSITSSSGDLFESDGAYGSGTQTGFTF